MDLGYLRSSLILSFGYRGLPRSQPGPPTDSCRRSSDGSEATVAAELAAEEAMNKNELDVLSDVSRRLESAGIAFMVTGSMAMTYYAKPRMTRDIDIVVALTHADLETIVNLFKDGYYVDDLAVRRAIGARSIFNLIHNETIIKVDCIVLKSTGYRQEEFERRQLVTFGGFQTWIVSREDLILSKLYWAKDSRSEMQLGDVRNLLLVPCDENYLRSRAEQLGVSGLLEEILAEK